MKIIYQFKLPSRKLLFIQKFKDLATTNDARRLGIS